MYNCLGITLLSPWVRITFRVLAAANISEYQFRWSSGKFFESYIWGKLKYALIIECIPIVIKFVTAISLSNPFGGEPVTQTIYYKTFETINSIITPIWDVIGTFDIILFAITSLLYMFRKSKVKIYWG